MSVDDPRFARFSRALDAEWLRVRLESLTQSDADTEAALTAALAAADPLGPPTRPGWLIALGALLESWPGRLATAAAAGVLLVAGFVGGRALERREPSPLAHAIPPRPGDEPERRASPRALGAAPARNAGADEKFNAAMAHKAAADFAPRALPLLREAVALEPTHHAAQFWLGVALLEADRAAEAVSPLEQAVSLAPGVARYRYYLIFAHLRQGAMLAAARVLADLMRQPE